MSQTPAYPSNNSAESQRRTDAQAVDSNKDKPWQDCMLTGAAAFSGVGIYALIEAQKQGAFNKVRPKGAPVVGGPVTAALGVVFLTLGIGRLFI